VYEIDDVKSKAVLYMYGKYAEEKTEKRGGDTLKALKEMRENMFKNIGGLS